MKSKIHDFWHILSDGKFHHMVLMNDGSINEYYVDGKLISQTSDTNNSNDMKSCP
jgi:hypothetical protein